MGTAPKLRTAAEAVALIERGATVMVGGFGLAGTPMTLLAAVLEAPAARELTIVSNNLGEPDRGLGRLLLDGRVRKAVGSFFTSNRDALEWQADGRLEIELLPQGTLDEAIRAGGAGIGGFFVKTSAGTLLAAGREQRLIDGETYVLQQPLRADVALLKAARADELGNLAYARTARNFNPDMATAARCVIAEVEEIVPVGVLAPDDVVTPHVYVDVLVSSEAA